MNIKDFKFTREFFNELFDALEGSTTLLDKGGFVTKVTIGEEKPILQMQAGGGPMALLQDGYTLTVSSTKMDSALETYMKIRRSQ